MSDETSKTENKKTELTKAKFIVLERAGVQRCGGFNARTVYEVGSDKDVSAKEATRLVAHKGFRELTEREAKEFNDNLTKSTAAEGAGNPDKAKN